MVASSYPVSRVSRISRATLTRVPTSTVPGCGALGCSDIELDQIANVTKVSQAFLRGIEEEAYDELPAPVYVRGFLVAYARAIGLDSSHVAASYMARFEESKQGRRRGRLLGRR